MRRRMPIYNAATASATSATFDRWTYSADMHRLRRRLPMIATARGDTLMLHAASAQLLLRCQRRPPAIQPAPDGRSPSAIRYCRSISTGDDTSAGIRFAIFSQLSLSASAPAVALLSPIIIDVCVAIRCQVIRCNTRMFAGNSAAYRLRVTG